MGSRRVYSAGLWGLASLILMGSPVGAAPVGGVVTAGGATITQPNKTTTLISQTSPQAIINWSSFGIGANEVVQFLQPSSLAVALNRVTGTDPSVILGSLQSNGRIFLLNPNGILFGKGSTVDVAGLLATTLSMTDQDFLNQNYTLLQNPTGNLTAVVNNGNLTAQNGGYLVLVAPLVSNQGVLVANLGKVTLFAGTGATISLDGGLINYASQTGAPGNVSLTAGQLSDIVSQVVNNQQMVAAGSVVQQNGHTILAGAEGVVVNSGTITANGAPGSTAGTVLLQSTQATVQTASSITQANGVGTHSNGGSVRALSDGVSFFASDAQMSATAGSSGNGGTNEVSAPLVYADGTFNSLAAHGLNGLNLVDPVTNLVTVAELEGTATGDPNNAPADATTTYVAPTTGNVDLTIAGNGGGTISMQPGASVGFSAQAGNITFSDTADTLVASDDTSNHIVGCISMNSLGTIIAPNISIGNGTVAIQAGGNISAGSISAACVTVTSTVGTVTLGAINASQAIGFGTVQLNAAQGITVSSVTSAGSVTIESVQGNISIAGNLSFGAAGATVTAGNNTLPGNISLAGPVVSSLGEADIGAGTNISVASVSAASGIFLTAEHGTISATGLLAADPGVGPVSVGSALQLSLLNVGTSVELNLR